ncbi:MAG TPA: TonB-dependent receptor [Rhizomicrobium sp.]|nr:TonB-dependent receptor [Rhizomicrobium sp.]
MFRFAPGASRVSRKLLLSSVALPVLWISAAGAQTANGGSQATAQTETVVVTGSLIARPDYNTATPTVTTTPDALQQSGQIALEQGLIQLPQFSAVNAGAGPFIGGSGEVNVNLRGLGAQRNLVLLDGRRLLPSASDGTVDLNQLPQGIIGNVEIITGGASAVYGSDAISGVVNFKTRPTPEGLEIAATYGTTAQYGGSQYDVNAVGGLETNDGKGSVMFALEYTRRAKVNYASIPFLNQFGNYPVPLVSGEFAPGSNPINQTALDAYFAQFGAPAGNVKNSEALGFDNNGSLFNVGPNPKPPIAVYDLIPQTNAKGQPLENIFGGSVHHTSYAQWEQNPLDRWSAFTKGDWALNKDTHAYIQALYTSYTGLLNVEPTVTSATQVPTVPITNPFIPSTLASLLATRPNPTAPFNLNDRFYSFGYRTITNANNIYQFVGGFDGTLRDTMTWDIYGSHGQTVTNYSSTGAVRFSVIQQMLNDPTGGTDMCAGGYDPFGLHPVSQACQQLAAPVISQRTIVTQDVINADVQGTLWTLPAGDMKFALGADYRDISFSYQPDAEIQAGDPFTYNPQTPTKGSSPVRELFGESLIPVIKDRPMFQSVDLDIAARYSDYALSGETATYKGDLNWSVIDGLRLRGGYERAIRAPSVSELFSGNSTYYANISVLSVANTASDPCDVRLPYVNGPNGAQVQALCAAQGLPAAIAPTYTNNNSQIPAIAEGNPNLKPEVADTFTGGAVYQPTFDTPWLQNLSISLDYYNIKLKHAIQELTMNTIVDNCFNLNGANPTYSASNYFCTLINRSPTNGTLANSLTPYNNIGQIKTSGVDLEANWLTDFGEITGWGPAVGTLSVSDVGSYLNDFKQQILPGTPFQEQGGTDISPYFPTWRNNATFTYHNWDTDFGLRWRFIGGMKDQSVITNPNTKVPGQHPISYFDLTISNTVASTDTRLTLVVSNLFNTSPQEVGGFVGNTDPTLYSPLGRIYLLTLDQKL